MARRQSCVVALVSLLLVAPADARARQAPDNSRPATAPAAAEPAKDAPPPATAPARPAGAGEAARTPPLRSFNLPGAPDPPAPTAPGVITRGANGRVVVRATRLVAPLTIDGVLDEEIYATVPPVSDFIQTVPNEGAPASERTEAWVTYDDKNFYLSCRCYDSAPPEEWTANELRRDTNQLRQNDMFGALLDTFHDRRNGFNFYTNPLGARADQVVSNEGNPNADWNPVWYVRTGRFDGGWTVEMAIPFRSIRYVSGEHQEWGLQIRRAIRRKNEWTHLTFVPAATGGVTSIFRASQAATLVDLDLPPAAKNVEIKPYAISKLTSDRVRTPAVDNDWDPDVGGDAKYGISANMTADLTVNTDFAQVEVDEQQVNLTRFALQFPEKRDFFLEGRSTFEFGRQAGSGAGGFTGQLGITTAAPQLFFTRRIGINNGREVPIWAGGRVTGTMGKTAVGVMNMETGYESPADLDQDACAPPYGQCTPATNFTVLRVKRDVLRRSTVGAIFTNRSTSSTVEGTNRAYGVDGQFSFFQNVSGSAYAARSESPHLSGDDTSYQLKGDYGADRYGARIDFLDVGANYNPEIGFVNRRGFGRTFGSLRFSPRMARGRAVRRYLTEGSVEYLVNRKDEVESRRQVGRFHVERQNSDTFTLDVAQNYELLPTAFVVWPGAVIPRGGYNFLNVSPSYAFGQQRRMSGTIGFQVGQFYNGDIRAVTVSGARVAILKQFSVEPSLSYTQLALPTGTVDNTLIRARTDYAFTPLMFFSALLQYGTGDHALSSNLRYRWEYTPGSELFVVYTDDRDTWTRGYPGLKNRAFVVKFNRLFRF